MVAADRIRYYHELPWPLRVLVLMHGGRLVIWYEQRRGR
jgi:hypothetical protein